MGSAVLPVPPSLDLCVISSVSQAHSGTINPTDCSLSEDGPLGTVPLLLKCYHCANIWGIPLLKQTSTLQSSHSRGVDLVSATGKKSGGSRTPPTSGTGRQLCDTRMSGGEKLERKRLLCCNFEPPDPDPCTDRPRSLGWGPGPITLKP